MPVQWVRFTCTFTLPPSYMRSFSETSLFIAYLYWRMYYCVVGAVNWAPYHRTFISSSISFVTNWRKSCILIDIGRFDVTLSHAFCQLRSLSNCHVPVIPRVSTSNVAVLGLSSPSPKFVLAGQAKCRIFARVPSHINMTVTI